MARSWIKLREWTKGLGLAPRLLDRIRLYERGGHAIIWFESGLATIVVPGVFPGGGVGLSVRNSGWM